jgi:hypothetical protein
MVESENDVERRGEPDIEFVTSDDVFHNQDSAKSRVDFEIAFFTVLLTIVLAYPTDTSVYTAMKALLVLFAVLTVVRRVVVMTEYRGDATRFMTYSKDLMVEISTLGIVYAVVILSEAAYNTFQVGNSLWIFVVVSIVLGFIPPALYTLYAQDDARLNMMILSSQWAHKSPLRYWRRYHRNQAVKRAQKIELPEEELPEEALALREKTVRRTLPFPGEIAQFLHGLVLRLVRWSVGALLGWAVFRNPSVSVALLISITLVGSQIHRLYRRYGLEGYSQRLNPKRRRFIQSLTVLAAHPLLLS